MAHKKNKQSTGSPKYNTHTAPRSGDKKPPGYVPRSGGSTRKGKPTAKKKK